MERTESVYTPPSRRERTLRVGVALCFAAAILVSFVSNNLNSRFQHHGESIAQQYAVLNGDPLLFNGRDLGLREWRSRVLFPIVFTTVAGVSHVLSVSQWFLVLRTLTAFAAFGCFWFLVRKTVRGDVRLAAAGLLVLAFEVVFTFNEGWENTTDFPDVAFTALFLWAILTRRRWWLVGLVLLATLNREVSVFAGLMWLVVYGIGARLLSIRWREVAFGVGLSLVAYAEALTVRTILTPPPSDAAPALGGAVGSLGTRPDPGYIGQLTHALSFWGRTVADVSEFIQHPTLTSWPLLWVAMLTPAVAWLWLNRGCLRSVHRRLLLVAVALIPISLAYGTPSELREYLMPLTMLAYLAVALEGERTRRLAPPVGVVYAEPVRDPVEV